MYCVELHILCYEYFTLFSNVVIMYYECFLLFKHIIFELNMQVFIDISGLI